MTSTNTLAQPETERPPTQRLQLSATQLIASALAAVTATVAGSFLGVSGTVIGAAIASVLTVTGNAVYGHSLKRTSERVRTVVPPAVRRHSHDVHGNPVESGHTGTTTTEPVEKPPHPALSRRQLAIAAVGLFAVVLALVTTVELAAGRPLSDLLRGKSGHGTTVFGPTHHSNTDKHTPPPTVTQTVTPSIVTTTPTVTQTAPTVTTTTTPTTTPTTSAPSTPTTPATSPTPTGVPIP
jgi:hypothetical protein